VRAALAFVLKHNRLNGHTCLPQDKLVEATANLLEIDPAACESALKEMIEENTLILDTINEKECIFLPSLYDGETYIAARMKMLLRFPAMAIGGAEEKSAAIEKESGIEYATLQK
jgi:exodeoxyribonuclease V alpha subunit